MSANQKTRLLVAARDLVRALRRDGEKNEDLLPVLGALRFELASACQAPMPRDHRTMSRRYDGERFASDAHPQS